MRQLLNFGGVTTPEFSWDWIKAAELRGESSMLNHGVTWLTVRSQGPGDREREIFLREGVAGEHRNLEKMVGKLFFFSDGSITAFNLFLGPVEQV